MSCFDRNVCEDGRGCVQIVNKIKLFVFVHTSVQKKSDIMRFKLYFMVLFEFRT